MVQKFRPGRFLAAALVCGTALVSARAVMQKEDLAGDLGYLRVHSFADSAVSISAELAKQRSLVLDLRYATASEGDGAKLQSWLTKRTPGEPAIILVSPATPASLAGALSPLPAGVVTIGVRDSKPRPAVVVVQEAAVDRRAFDAADSGMPIAELINGRIDKERFDEAALVREFRNEPAPAPKTAAKDAAKDKAPVLTDRVLQRALNVHRALRAIKP